MKIKIRGVLILFLFTGLMMAMTAAAADDIKILKIDTLIMEKGSETYSLTVKAFVTNNSETEGVAIDVVAVDKNGFELQNATLTGSVEPGKTRVLIGVVKIPKDVYNEIVKWEWKQ